MKRKLIRQGGGGGLVAYMPSKWVKELKLQAGDEINVEEINTQLIISAKRTQEKRGIEIGPMSAVSARYFITSLYGLGFDKIKINLKTKQDFKALKEFIDKFIIGFEITKKEPNSCTIESISEPSPEQFDQIFWKLRSNITALLDLTEKRLKKEKIDEDPEELNQKANLYRNFCARALRKRHVRAKDPSLYGLLITSMEYFQAELIYIHRFLDKNPIKTSKGTLSLLKDIQELFQTIEEAITKKDLSKIEKTFSSEKRLFSKRSYSLLSTIKGKETIIIHHLASMLMHYDRTAGEIISLTLNK